MAGNLSDERTLVGHMRKNLKAHGYVEGTFAKIEGHEITGDKANFRRTMPRPSKHLVREIDARHAAE